ncbi:MAG: DUF4835 family protein [Bacteroidota bacterium]
MKRYIFIICLIQLLYGGRIFSQELDCTVTLQNVQQLSSDARDNVADFAQQITQYLNSQKYTKENYGDAKIHVEITVSFQGQNSQNSHHYVASAFFGSLRPINRAQKNTALVRLIDDQWEFDYTRYQQLQHDDFRFDALTSFLDFYANIIVGYDIDTYKFDEGTPYFSKAMEIFNRAKSSPGPPKGWDITTQGAYSRGQFIDELLNSKYADYLTAIYKYHFHGLDYLAQKPDLGKKHVLSALKMIADLRVKINQKSLLITSFFDTKHDEIAETFKGYPDATILDQLVKIDPAHTQQYTEAIRGQ